MAPCFCRVTMRTWKRCTRSWIKRRKDRWYSYARLPAVRRVIDSAKQKAYLMESKVAANTFYSRLSFKERVNLCGYVCTICSLLLCLSLLLVHAAVPENRAGVGITVPASCSWSSIVTRKTNEKQKLIWTSQRPRGRAEGRLTSRRSTYMNRMFCRSSFSCAQSPMMAGGPRAVAGGPPSRVP